MAQASKGLGPSIKTAIVLPCDDQGTGWGGDWRDRYYKAIENADSALTLTCICESVECCYDMAGWHIIDRCDVVIAATVGVEEPDVGEYARVKKNRLCILTSKR